MRISVWPAGTAVGLAAACLVCGACLNFRPAVQPAGPEAEPLLFCRGVALAGGLFEAVDAASAFGPEDESVYALARLGNVAADISLRWRWYAPDGRLVRDSGRVRVEAEGKFLEVVTSFDRLDFGPQEGARPPGAWRVVLFVGDDLAVRGSFLVNPSRRQDSRP